MAESLSRRGTLLTWAFWAVSLGVFGFGLSRFLAGRYQTVVRDLSGHEVKLGGSHWEAVVVASVEDDAPLVHALELGASERAQRAEQALDAIVLATDAKPVLQDYIKRAEPRIVIVSLQENLNAARTLLTLEDTRKQLFLFNPSRELVFHGGQPHPMDVKLLLQRFLPLQEAPPSPLKIGDTLALHSVRNVRTLRREQPPVPPLLV